MAAARKKSKARAKKQAKRTLEKKPAEVSLAKVLAFKGRVFSGRLASQNTNWAEARTKLAERETNFFLSKMNGRSALSESNVQMSSDDSYYKAKFRQGADLMPRRFYFVECDQDLDGLEVVSATSNLSVDAKPPYDSINMSGLVDTQCLFRTAISQNIVPFAIHNPMLVHLPLMEKNGSWEVLTQLELAQNDLGNSARWFDRCDKLYSKKTELPRGKLLTALNYNNKLLVQDPGVKNWVIFNAAGTNVSAALMRNTSRFWADQRTYWHCPDSAAEGAYLAAILNAPSLNLIIKPFQSMGLAGERDIHKKVLELIPKFDPTNLEMASLSSLGTRAAESLTPILRDLDGKSITTKRKKVRTHLDPLLREIDRSVKNILEIRG